MKKLISEPLVQFLCLGFLLFIGHEIWSASQSSNAHSIIIDDQTRSRLAAVFKAEQSRTPSDEEMRALIVSYVQEQSLSREAMRAGLDSDDTIITRRLAQKMRFMLEDNAAPADPGDAILTSWFNDNRSDFTVPEGRAISHIFISPNQGADVETRATAASVLVKENPRKWNSIGDPFLMARDYGTLEANAMSRVFGRDFTASVFALPAKTDVWSAPIESAFGLHLVRIDNIRRLEETSFEDARNKVLSDWQSAQVEQNNIARLKAVVEKYKVIEK